MTIILLRFTFLDEAFSFYASNIKTERIERRTTRDE